MPLNKPFVKLVIFTIIFGFSFSALAAITTAPYFLRVDYCENPLGITNSKPVFSWLMKDKGRAEKQTAYEILVASSIKNLSRNIGDVWSTGWVSSDQQNGIPYTGKPFLGKTTYYWKVRLKDAAGKASLFSAVSIFETSILSAQNWQAKWIFIEDHLKKPFFNPNTVNYKDATVHPLYDLKNWEGNTWLNLVEGKLIRKEFRLPAKAIKKARIYIANLGYYELRLNGKKVGDHVLDPGMTDCTKRVLSVTYDVKDLLLEGGNAIGVMLSTGRLINCKDGLKLQLEVEFVNGLKQVVTTDTTWKGTLDAPFKSVTNWGLSKELFDATKVQAGWDEKGFDDRLWETVKENNLSLKIDAQLEPIRVIQTLKPIEMIKVSDSIYMFNMGQNFSGWARIHIKGTGGKLITVQYSDSKKSQMDFNQQDIYVLKGDGTETFEPRFTYHGFQWVTVIGYPGTPSLESIEGRVVHTDLKNAGEFTCSNELLNQLYKNNKWTLRSNLHSVYTDCPSREKVPWLGQWVQEDLSDNFDMGKFFLKWKDDLAAAQQTNGRITDKTPGRIHYGSNGTDPVWVSEVVLGTWDIYRVYGDKQNLAESYLMLQKLIAYYKSIADTNYIIKQNIWGDWVGLDKPTPAFLSTAYFYKMVKTMALIASELKKKEDVIAYGKLADKIGKSLNDKFYVNGGYDNNSQGANAVALHFELVPSNLIQTVLESLEKAIAKKDYHISTGGATTYNLMNALWMNDKTELAYRMATQTTFPGWGFWVANGATTSWEQWEIHDGSSKNHGWLGSYLNTWMVKAIGGISTLEPGYKRIKIIPGNVAGLTYAKSAIETIRGRITFDWTMTPENTLEMKVTIPPNSIAEIYVPLKGMDSIQEGTTLLYSRNKQQNVFKYVTSKGEKGKYSIWEIGSGTYKFVVHYKL
jgi:alpha-L-rhamnosidase